MRTRTFAAMVLAAACAAAAWAQTPGAPPAQPAAAAGASATELDDLLAKGLRAGEQLSTAEVQRAIELGAALFRPHAVAPLVKAYLARNPAPAAPLLKLAAENARLTGDYRTAITRQKQYLRALPAGAEASRAAAELCGMLMDIDGKDEAHAFMKQSGEALRATVDAKKYDEWFIQVAWERNDLAGVARWLAVCMGDQGPVELERLLYWDDLDRLIDATRQDNAAAYDALPQMRRIVDLIRESPARQARLRFQTDYLTMCAGARGKEAAALTAEFAPVAASAQAWLDAAPRGETLAAVCAMWSNGGRDAGGWQEQLSRAADAKLAFFKQAFARLSPAEQAAFHAMADSYRLSSIFATPETWLELVRAAPPSAERNGWASRVELPWRTADAALHKAAAPALAGVNSGGAAVMRALAAGDEYRACLLHLAQNESWFLGSADEMRSLADLMSNVYRSFPRDDAGRLQQGAMEQAFARYLVEVYFKSPLALMNRDINRIYMTHVWQWSDRTKTVEYLHLLDWAPLSAGDRQHIYGEVQNQFRAWSESVRREQEAAAKRSPEEGKKFDAVIALIEPIGQALRQVVDPAVYDAGKAPGQLCQNMAREREALDRKDRDAALAAGRAAYAALRDYEAKKTPFGRICLGEVLRPRPDVDMMDLLAEALTDQMNLHLQDGSAGGLDAVLAAIAEDLRLGSGGRISALAQAQGEDRVRLEAAISKAVLAMLGAGKFNARLFNLYRETRIDNPASREIMTKLVEGKVLMSQPDYRLDGRINAATTYQWLLEREFPWMNDKYPRDRYFDDMFAEEVAKTGRADPQFWQRSADGERKGANAVAAVMKGFARLPFGYDGGAPVYSRDEFWSVAHDAAARADEGARQAMLSAAEAAFGTTRFDDYAIGAVGLRFTAIAEAPETRKAFFDRLGALLGRALTQPRQVVMPGVAGSLTSLSKAGNISDAELAALKRAFSELRINEWDYETAFAGIELVHDAYVARKRAGELLAEVPGFWAAARALRDGNRRNDLYGRLVTRAAAAAENNLLELAASHSTAAMSVGEHLPDHLRKTVESIRAQTLVALGGVIPVDRGDRRYPIYAAQLAYLAGQYDQAWSGYAGARDLMISELKNLDPLFAIWAIERCTAQGEYEQAERLARAMIETVETATVQMSDNEARGRLFLAYADIALARQEYPRAKAQYERIALAKEYDGTRAKGVAEVKVADVERLTRDYAGATKRLEELLQRDDRYLQTQANYLLALVKYDQEDYAGARDNLNQALQLDPTLAEGRILEGRLYLKLKKLIEATQLKLGLTASQRILVPGRVLTIQLEDRNLSVVGAAMGIEVRVWTASGDEEIFNLLPFGDSKVRFEGQIATALGAAVKGDRMLQVLGGDEVRYDFSERFKQINKLAGAEAPPVTVMSDPQMFASSGEILSEEEMAEAALEAQIRARLEAQAAQGDAQMAAVVAALSTVRKTDEVKPGNSISVRVVDPDRSVSAGKDTVHLRAVSSSGDSVPAFYLEETGEATGIFDGKLKTGIAPATAFASDSNEGADPNFAVSGGDHPPWVGLTDGKRPKSYAVDLNDNVALKKLTVLADVPARRLKRFIVQTSLNGRDFETVGAWPEQMPAWDGALRITLVKGAIPRPAANQMIGVNDIREFFAVGSRVPGAPDPVILPGALAVDVGQQVMGQADKLGISHDRNSPDSWYVLHMRGGFYLSRRAERTFRANVRGVEGGVFNILAVDGKVAAQTKEAGVALTGSFGKGVHVLDFYLWAQRGAAPSFTIEWDTQEPPYFAPCPADMFDIARNPQISAALTFKPAAITAQADNNGFDIDFAAESQARVIRLGLLDFEGDAPAIRRLALSDAKGGAVLPTKEDLLALRKNDVLETLPGDQITITYEDPTPITPERRVQEARLSATFNNASLSACFIETKDDGRGGREAFYVPMRRFRLGDAINVFIRDPDCDVSDKADVVKFTARSSSGASVTLDALESDPKVGGTGGAHSGVFLGRIFTVEEAPKRESEMQLQPNDDIQITYRDAENTDYGIPWERSILVEQAGTNPPVLRMFDLASTLMPTNLWVDNPPSNELQKASTSGRPSHWQAAELMDEFVPKHRVIGALRRDSTVDESTSTGMVVCPVLVEITWPAVALSPLSTVRLHAQTLSSRTAAGVTDPNAFDPKMPGTVTYETTAGTAGAFSAPPGYLNAQVRFSEASRAGLRGNALDEGEFTFAIPLQLGAPSTAPASDPEERRKQAGLVKADGLAPDVTPGEVPPGVLAVRPDDEIVIGFEYQDGTNNYWVVRRVSLSGDAALDVMDRRYQQPVRAINMGDQVFLRVIDPTADASGQKDEVGIDVHVGDAAPVRVPLSETFPHSGVFKGMFQVVTTREADTNRPGILGASHGQRIALTYKGGSAAEELRRAFSISKGADGAIQSFTKRFKDPNIAVQTQFTVAESYFELAKNHRQLKQEELARREIAQGRKLLEEAIRDFPQTEARAQAEYLLAELSLELAQDTTDEVAKKKHYGEAMQRFSEIVSTYGESPYAPKSQFKKALTLEKMGEIDQACEEYVKLSYKYPDNELVAETIARLGQYFLTKGKGIETEIAAAADPIRREKLRLQSVDMFKTAAQVFARLAKRFPDHQLAEKTTVLSGQCWMRAGDFERAVAAFKVVIEGKRGESELVAEAMYWCGDSYLKLAKTSKSAIVDAYRMLKKLTWDYPESQWAKYARGRLTEPALAQADSASGG